MNKLTPAQLMYISGYVPTSLEDIVEFAQGGIHIKPSHVGRFTEYKKRTGKTTEEALHSPDPHVRQMANFARNAAKWKHEFGGTPMLESDNQDYEHNIYDDKSGDMLRQKQKGVLLSFINNPNPVVEEPEFSYKQQGGAQQEQIMQLIQMYAQLAKVDPKQLMQQLQQMPPEQQQAALQQMAEQVQSVQSQGQETMAAGGIPTQYRLRGENVNKLNDFTTNLGMLGEAGNLVTTASAIDNPIAQGIAGVAGLIGGLGTAVRGLSWGADKLFGNNNMKDNQKYQDYFSKMSKQFSKLPANVGKASTPKKGMFDVNTPTEIWNQSKPSNKLWDIYGAPQRNKEWDTYMSNQQILKNLPDFSKLRFGKGGEMIKRADGSYSRRGLWDNIRANKGSGKKPTKEMLEQERKIKSKEYGGGIDNPGFNALPEYVQEKIIANMSYGGDLPKAQAGRNDLPFPVGVGNYADAMYDPYSMNIANGYGGANPSQSVYLSDEEVANQNGMYDGYAFPGGPISKINDTGKVNPNVINISGQQLALNGLTSLGAANQALGYLQNNNKYFERRQRDAGNTMFNEAINPIAAQGNYTTNAGPASNFQLNKNVYAQSLSRYGGKTKSYKAGGQYNVSEEELLQLMKDGAEIEFL